MKKPFHQMIRNFDKKMDEDFIYHSWIHSVKNPTKIVMDMTRVLIDDLVEKNQIKVYHNLDDPNHILGWVAYGKIEETPLLHFVFVKRDLRRAGIATALIDHVFPPKKVKPKSERWAADYDIFCTHWSHYMQQLNAKDLWGTRYAGSLLPACIYEIMTNKLENVVNAA